MADIVGVPEGEGTWLSPRTVDDAASGPPRSRAWTGGGAYVPGQPRAGHGVQDPRPGGSEAAQSAILPGTARSRLCGKDGRSAARLSSGENLEEGRARAIIQRGQRAFGHGALDAALDRLMMQPERSAHRKKRGVFSIGQQYPRPLYPARRLSPRLRYRSQLRRIRISKRQLNRPPPRCHDLEFRSLGGTRDICRSPKSKMNPPLMTTFMESVV